MKLLVRSQLMLVILFALQTQIFKNFHCNGQVLEYSEERIFLVKALVGESAHSHSPSLGGQEDEDGKFFSGEEQLHQQQQQLFHNPQYGQNKNNNQQQLQQHQSQNPPIQNQRQHPQQVLPQQQFHHKQMQQEQPLHQQRENFQTKYNEQHHSPVDSIQDALLETSRYHYTAAQLEYQRSITQDGEINQLLIEGFESIPASAPDELSYYRYHHVHHQIYNTPHKHHLMYSGPSNDDHFYDANNHHSSGSCESESPSMLMQGSLGNPTCEAMPQGSIIDNNPNHAEQSSGNVPNLSKLTNGPSQNSNVESFPLIAQHYHYESSLMGAIRHYWREVSGLCLASAIFLNWLFVVIKRRFIASGLARVEHVTDPVQQTTSSQSVSKDTNSSSAHDSAFEETVSPNSLEYIDSSKSSSDDQNKLDKSTNSVKIVNTSSTIRQRSSTLRAEPIPIPLSPGNNSPSTSLSNSLNTSDYNSRYSSDFDSIQRLGRGGFGIVFEARNKIDDCHYAVKRICLPLEKEARERVMREVRALAKLDHAGIVRYYNAWLETPPDEWLKQHDAQLGIVHSKDGGLSFPSTDGIYDRNESEQISKGASKLGESGDNSSSLFNSSPFKRRANGFRKGFLKNNSSSPSLDIVFEGSGSIRLESENNTEKTGSSVTEENNEAKGYKKEKLPRVGSDGDIISDSEDSDFIQFESKSNKVGSRGKDKLNNDEVSISGHLTEPFSSSSGSGDSDSKANEESIEDDIFIKSRTKPVFVERQKALHYQRELRHLNNASLVENLHVEKVYLYIQMQLCRKDTLKDWLKTNCENRDKTTIFDLFYQIVDAVEYVHSQDLIHRDLKPSNIFFSLDGTLKIGDFGLCRAKTSTGIGSSLDLQEYVAESDVERGFEAVHTEQVGTQLYMSPEQLNGLSYNQKVDIFAMGLILLELLLPFRTQMQRVNVLFKARNNLYSDEFRSEHPQEYELVKSLLSRSPQKRPTATEIKQHELLASAQLSQPVIERIYHRRRTISSNSSTE